MGARACTPYGREQAFFFARELARCGVQIVSGLAYGIDAAAHEGAIKAGGKTFAVLGCGTDICYPKENYPLMQKMLETGGGVLSEFPDKTPPLSWHFPVRNRVISGLSDILLIIEAKEKSGSLITAEHALEQGKTVFALPGRTTDPCSRGCNRLIADGALIALAPEDLLRELGVFPKKKEEPEGPSYGKKEEGVLLILQEKSRTIAEVSDLAGLSPEELTRILLELEMDGRVEENPPGCYHGI